MLKTLIFAPNFSLLHFVLHQIWAFLLRFAPFCLSICSPAHDFHLPKTTIFFAKNPFLRQFLLQKVVISSVLGESKVTPHGAKSST
jgi:hypothetical protein